MAYEQKPNTGALFVNEQKKSENHPDWRGEIYLDKTFVIEQMDKSDGSMVKIAISSWTKKAKSSGKDYMSLAASEPWVKKDDDLPY